MIRGILEFIARAYHASMKMGTRVDRIKRLDPATLRCQSVEAAPLPLARRFN